jgi:CubicO group peptidase (beta-lactamase class C family)
MKNLLPFLFLCLCVLASCHEEDPQPDQQLQTDSAQSQNQNTELNFSQMYFPSATEWQTIAPENLSVDNEAMNDILDFVAGKNTYGFMMLYKGRIVIEKYWNGWDAGTHYPIASASKSIMAFLYGIAQEKGFLKITDNTSAYLGEGWTTAPKEKEKKITLRHHLSMSTGLDETITCTSPDCFKYKAEPGSRWAYHNEAYYLLQNVLEKATGTTLNDFTKDYLADKIGLSNTSWEDHNIALSTRDMARFGLLIDNQGAWQSQTLLSDKNYFQTMLSPSTQKNKSYGLLWWLNDGDSFMIPGDNRKYNGRLIPSAPAELISAMGKGDKKIYILPSKHIVIVRHGDDTGDNVFGPSSFDNELWAKLTPMLEKMTLP